MKNSIYWIIGIVVILLLGYWIFASPKDDVDTTTDLTPSDEEVTTESVSIDLSAQSSSGQTGTAVLTEVAGKTQVVITTTGAASLTAPQPAHIHVGACPTPGAVKYPLTSVIAGTSTSTVDVSLADLKAALPLAINIHKSAAETAVYTACGDITF